MASIVRQKTDSGIRYLIQLSPGENEARPKIRLGEITKSQAETAKLNIESVIKCKNTGAVISPAVQEWLTGIADGLRKRLTVIGIIERGKRGQSFTVAEWVSRYINGRSDVKAITKGKWENAANKLSAFFRGQNIEDVTIQQAKDFRVHLKSVDQLSENTVRRLIGLSWQFFKAAIDAGLLDKNPFEGQPIAVLGNPQRFYYVKQEEAQKVLDACPNAEWQLIFALCRYGGLRCPSEILGLTWQDINWDKGRMLVRSPKTEHHIGHESRLVPLFPELVPYLREIFEQIKPGTEYVITHYRKANCNLRTQLKHIITKAGLKSWPKLFQNLRSTRETELVERWPEHIVCAWIGNSKAVAKEHYLQVTEEHFERAAKMPSVLDATNSFIQGVK